MVASSSIMRKMKYKIGIVEFNTQQQIRKFCQSIIRMGNPVSDEMQHFLFSFSAMHPRFQEKYQDKKIVGFQIATNPLYKHKSIQAILDDGSCDDIAVNNILRKRCTKVREQQILAYRSAIVDQILHFKRLSKQICVVCRKTDCLFHVDHVIKFRNLITKFEENNTPPTEINQLQDVNQFYFKNKIFAKTWADFHRGNCDLRMLCATCNLRIK